MCIQLNIIEVVLLVQLHSCNELHPQVVVLHDLVDKRFLNRLEHLGCCARLNKVVYQTRTNWFPVEV